MTNPDTNPMTTRLGLVGLGVMAFGLWGCPSDPAPTPTDSGSPMDASDVQTPTDNPQPTDTPRPTDNPQPTDNPPPTDAPGDGGMTTDAADVPTDAPSGMPTARLVVSCGSTCTRPLDAIPDTTGANIFFTAFNATGEAAVFRVAATGGAITQIASGNGLEFPLGITLSNDDSTIFVADQSADRGMSPGAGAIFRIPAAGGTPTVVSVGDELIQPAALTISSNGMDLLITARRRTMAGEIERALFRVPTGGGVATVVNTDLVDPSGVTQAADGTILCHDTRRGGDRSATAVRIGGMTSDPVAGSLVAGYPAGLSFSNDGRSVLLSGADPLGAGGLLTWASGAAAPVAPPSLSMGMVAPQGLHRARSADRWAVADEQATGSGAVFMVSAP